MTIRFTCAECASVLKIKDELAGTSARCPKCKTKFVVPNTDEDESAVELELAAKKSQASANPTSDVKPTPESREESADEDMDTQADTASLSGFGTDSHSDLRGGDTPQDQPTTQGSSDWDDDDLDSPPVLVNDSADQPDSPAAASDAPLELPSNGPDVRKKRSQSDVFERAMQAEESAKKGRPAGKRKSDSGFDPVQFLMDDEPGARDNRFSPGMVDDSDLSLPDDSDVDVLNRPSPVPVRRSSAPKPPSRPTPEKIDLAAAAKMMKKAMKDAQTESARQAKLAENPRFDYLQIFREIGFRGLGIIVGCIVMVLAAQFFGNYLFSSRLKTPPLGVVHGKVTLDGQPVPNAFVFFSPRKTLEELQLKGSKRDRERASVGVTDMSGNYRMMYSREDKIEGVAIGNCHVWVVHNGSAGNDVPAHWSEGAVKQMEVKSGSQQIDMSMTTEPPATSP